MCSWPWIYFQIISQCTLIWPCVMQLTAGRIKYNQHLLFPLCWPKYLKLTSCQVDDNNEFILRVLFWAAGSPVFWTQIFSPTKEELFIFWHTLYIL